MIRKIFLFGMLSILCLACREQGLSFKLLYDQIDGLKEKDRVIFEGNEIGGVTSVIYTSEGRYSVDVLIKHEFSNAVTERSKFVIISDPENRDRKAVEVVCTEKGGRPLQDGATIEGSSSSSAVFGQIWGEFQNNFEDLKEQFEKFSRDLKNAPIEEELERLSKELERLSEEMKQAGDEGLEKFQKEILPRLNRELERLREWLRKLGREEDVKPLEVQMEELRKI